MEGNANFKYFTACFLYPGVAFYPNDSTLRTVLIDNYIDEIANSFIGSPVVIGHNQPLSENDPIIRGKVIRVFCNTDGFITREGVNVPADRKYYCDFYVDAEGAEAAKKLGYVSCSYHIAEGIYPQKNSDGEFEKLSYINIPYEVEAKKVQARHLAIVDDKARYEQAVIYENSTESDSNINYYQGGLIYNNEPVMEKEFESKIEIESGVSLSFLSSAKDKGREILSKIFDNAKKKENEDKEEKEEKRDNAEDEDEKDEKKNKKDKKNCSMKKNKKSKKENEESEDDDMEEEDDEVDNSKEEEEEEKKNKKNKKNKKDNSIDIDGEELSIDYIKELHNKAKENSKDNATKDNSVDLESIQSKAFTASAVTETPFVSPINGKALFGSKHKQ